MLCCYSHLRLDIWNLGIFPPWSPLHGACYKKGCSRDIKWVFLDVVSLLSAFLVVAVGRRGCAAGVGHRALPLKLVTSGFMERILLREIAGGEDLLSYPEHYEIAHCCEFAGPFLYT